MEITSSTSVQINLKTRRIKVLLPPIDLRCLKQSVLLAKMKMKLIFKEMQGINYIKWAKKLKI